MHLEAMATENTPFTTFGAQLFPTMKMVGDRLTSPSRKNEVQQSNVRSSTSEIRRRWIDLVDVAYMTILLG